VTTTGTSGTRAVVQFPHPGGEHAMPPSGMRGWPAGNRAHRRTFLESIGTYRTGAAGADLRGRVAFWGEWEGAADLVRELHPLPFGPHWLCRPNTALGPPRLPDGVPPQNTDPFVWGDAIKYAFCRQPGNRKLRELGRGTVILFGSSPSRGFELDTVLVVDRWHEHRRRSDLHGLVEPACERWTVDPMYGWGEETEMRRLYLGAAPETAVDGMFSFVPCQPADTTAGFVRPLIELDGVVDPNLRMQARVIPVSGVEARRVWETVVEQVLGADLALAVRLELGDADRS